jgi:hypothetical protein
VTEIELAELIAKLRQMVAHARTHGCFDGGVRGEITEAADKLEALAGRISTLEELVYFYVDPSDVRPEHEEIVKAISLAQTQSEG